jgi:translation initiation factor IF-2
MVFAINKIDKPGADPTRIKQQLAEMNLLVEDWGGEYQCQEMSALKGIGVDDLLERVMIVAEMLDLKANPSRGAVGTVIESRLDKGRGHVATVLVENGTLTMGAEMVAGIHYGRVRALIDQNGERIRKAGPATPVQVLGIGGMPTAGDKFYVFEEEGKAKNIAQRRAELFREQQMRQTSRLTLEEIGRRRALGNFKELNIVIRGDVDGSVEALSGALLKLSTEEVKVNIIAKAVGAINEADINLAIASDAIVLAFNVRPNGQARNLAERESVDIRTYSVIYDAINDVRDALEGLLSPEIKEEIIATADIREVFNITKVGNVAGGLVLSGKLNRQDLIRVIRDGVVVHEGKLASLKRFKDDAKEVLSGMECGFMLDNYQDITVGDTIEQFRRNEIRRKLL